MNDLHEAHMEANALAGSAAHVLQASALRYAAVAGRLKWAEEADAFEVLCRDRSNYRSCCDAANATWAAVLASQGRTSETGS